MKRKLLLAALCVVGAVSFKAQAAQTPTADGVYYLYNPFSGKFLSRGADWGTQAVADDFGTPIKLIASGDNFQLQGIDNQVYYGDDYWMYADASGDRVRAYSLEAADGGYYLHNTSRDVADNRVYVYLNDDNNKYCIAGNAILGDNISDEGQAVWQFLSQAERDAIISGNAEAANVAAAAAADITVASTSALKALLESDYSSIDCTSSIGNASLENGYSAWTLTQPNRPGNVASNANGFECFEGRGTLTQTVTSLTPGLYKVTINGFHRDGNNAYLYTQEHTNGYAGMSMAYIDANGSRGQIKAWASEATSTTEPNSMSAAKALFNSGKYLTEVFTYVDEDGKLDLTIGFPAFVGQSWYIFDNVTLTRYKSNAAEVILPSSVSLNQSSASLTTGETLTLTATVTPDNADDKNVAWSSSDETVASVSNGVVTALKAGTATITATATAGENVTATCTITVADAAAPTFYSTTIAAEDYYIVNAATGKFLGGANSWGTQASLIEHGIPFTAALNNGTYTLDSHTYNNETAHFLSGTYVDGASTPLYITSVGDGKFSISTSDGSAFLTATAGTTVVANTAANAGSSLAQWYFLSKANRDKALAAATAENPVDATFYIKQANISRNLSAGASNENAWSNLSTGGTQENSNFVAQVYNAAVNVVQTIEGIPNGTYTLTMQGFTSGTDVKLYANDVEVDVRANDSGATSCAAASVLFAAKSYPNTLSVTVTDHTLKIGLKGDCTSSKWLCYDNFELYMTNYIPVTAIAASIEPEGDIEIGNTAQITFATTPSPASFDALTITSSDETVATVNKSGLVTAIAEGEATITIAAEMENVTKTFDITVVKPAVLPTSVVLDETEIALNATTTTATLSATVGEEGAPQAVVWTSSDEDVATVSSEGVVTAVLPGTATIRATALNYDEVYAEATVTVTFPETVVPESNTTNEGATRYINTLGENIIKNGVFEYPDAFYGWTKASDYSTEISSEDFTIKTDGEGNKYLVGSKNGGTGGAASLGTAWAIEAGKTYQFSYDVKKEGNGSDYQYLKTSLTNSPKTESKVLGYPTTMSNEWTTVSYTFTNTVESVGAEYQYLQIHFRWLSGQWGFRNFYLAEVSQTTEGNVDYATDAIPTVNIGTAAFQYSQDAIDAANALVQGEASVEDVQAAYDAVTTINEPEDGQLFNVVLTYGGWTYDNKAMTYIAGGRSDMGNYNIQYQEAANQNLAQAFTFTKVSGNNYKLSQIDADGVARYISTGVPYPEKNGNTAQIRTTTDASKALEVTIIPTATEGVYNLRNTEANQYIGSQDAGVYTVNSHINFFIQETSKPSITINTTAAGWGTTMLPFAVAELPEGVKAYTCAAVDGTTLTLAEVDALEANKPYIIEGVWNETLTGDAQGTALTYTEGLLTGVYTATAAPVGSYVLQNNDSKVGFYKVAEGKQPTVGANRIYLTYEAPAEGAKPRAFFFEADDATAISTIAAMTAGEVEGIYTIGGAKVQSLQKGVNILKMKNGQTRKVIVK